MDHLTCSFKFKTSNSWITSLYLWRDIIRSTAESGRGDAIFDSLFAHAEIGDLAVAVRVQEDVVQFEIAAKENG